MTSGYNLVGLLCGVLAVAFFAISRRFASRRDLRWRLRFAGFAGLLALPGLWQAAYYLHFLPETVWFYEARSWRGSELGVLPLGIFGGALASLRAGGAAVLIQVERGTHRLQVLEELRLLPRWDRSEELLLQSAGEGL